MRTCYLRRTVLRASLVHLTPTAQSPAAILEALQTTARASLVFLPPPVQPLAATLESLQTRARVSLESLPLPVQPSAATHLAGSGVLDTAMGSRASGPWVLRWGRELRGPRTLRTCILDGAVVRTSLGHLTQTLLSSAALLALPSWTMATAPTTTKRLLPLLCPAAPRRLLFVSGRPRRGRTWRPSDGSSPETPSRRSVLPPLAATLALTAACRRPSAGRSQGRRPRGIGGPTASLH